MGFEIQLALRGELQAFYAREAKLIGEASAAAVKGTAVAVQEGWRADIRARFAGTRGGVKMANAIRRRNYEDGGDGGASIVYSRFGRRGPKGFIDYTEIHATGGILRPRSGKWLYIPLEKTRRARGARAVLGGAKNIRFIPISGGRALLVRASRRRSTPIALLVKSVRIPKRLNLVAVTRREHARMPARIIQEAQARGIDSS